ncbi:hypothetical protein CO058_03545 [candidate division WWE3 bacterium CG_4_9_14_0_2_um_filter_35_11]|uniref:Uncharacterized protein n=1 Tax=candidate division WWE3 bacterium CG_4_9_14_0_2_um_filter_35_11 TaxID=1975077 RepID=A0A2M8EL01_UNCKA|nr:MAG: hypothetical protein COV25_02270 [candidate division WWE3 bacterium CG10_big_fil_rev_8_21_14_0_10_35_32]PJC23377.1 MAG: hypothetical protein CO058_03545 [candidate division WWE3 bacterium CG_4_9_14_0_2_um_filter_35_11]
MINSDIQKAREIVKNKPYLMWSTQNYNTLSPESILECVISYGNWDDFINLTKIFGMKKNSKLFELLKNKKRSNLRPRTNDYFSRYFKKHA